MAMGGRVREPFGIVANKSKHSQMHCLGEGAGGGWGKELNWVNFVPRKALFPSVIKDKTHVCNWHCYFISTSILKQ